MRGCRPTAQAIPAAFWGCRTTARMWKAPDLPAERVAELANLLQTALGQLPDRTLEIKPLEDQCVAALARVTTRPSPGRLPRIRSRPVACTGP